MKKFRHLEITAKDGDEQILIDLLGNLKNSINGGFFYQKSKSEEYARNIFLPKDKAACFKTKKASLFESCVWLYIMDGKLTVANITSDINHRLGIINYNMILIEFFNNIQPCLNERFNVVLTGEDVRLQDMLTEETYNKLSMWEMSCNRSSPISHPMDRERWFDFLISANKHNEMINTGDFQQWLQEDKQWPIAFNNEIEDLAIQLEYGLDLLDRQKQQQ